MYSLLPALKNEKNEKKKKKNKNKKRKEMDHNKHLISSHLR